MSKEKVLIIKVGYSETLTNEVSRTTSLGDVLRSTVILPLYKKADVTWLVDEKATPLLKGNSLVQRIMPYDLTTILQLGAERFDTVINLEKVAGICAFADSLSAWRRYGFRFDPEIGEIKAYDGSHHVLEICLKPRNKTQNKKYWEEILFEMIGKKWNGEIPMLGYKPKAAEIFDIGFNHHIGEKWPTKAWPQEYWESLEMIIGKQYTITWQKGLDSVEEYIEWINSCKLLITNDSLGLHIAHALGKKIVALFGPTISDEVYIKNGRKLLPETHLDCLPCMNETCTRCRSCMYEIRPEKVFKAVKELC